MALPRRRSLLNIWYIAAAIILASTSAPISTYAAGGGSRYQDCEPKSCGTGGPNISYPFYISNSGASHPAYCGLQGFNIRCQGGKPIYRTSASHYVIEDIDYRAQSFRVVNQLFAGRSDDGDCLMPLRNYSFDRSAVAFSPFHADLYFFYGCSNAFTFRIMPQIDYAVLGCNSSMATVGSTIVALIPLDESFDWNRESCRATVAAPVRLRERKELNESIAEVDYRKLLREGFSLEWGGGSTYDCPGCQTSGGRCGFEDRRNLCYCADGTSHPTNCSASGSVDSSAAVYKTSKLPLHSARMQAVLIIVSIAIVVFLSLCLITRRKRIAARDRVEKLSYAINVEESVTLRESRRGNSDLPFFNLKEMATATDNFSDANKLGKGGFGSVYKGTYEGNEIAVKRLSKNSGQGVEEFKNEVELIAKLQHKNLVRILGCCVQGHERMLVYEYLPNKSLDCFIFGKEVMLDWSTRYNIICGIARGILYLHEDSRLKIIHRDLKASNILLDASMNPKISDFGMARIFGVNQNEANTNRVVGTYGYMSPEYAMQGMFSVKSDVYSFGVMLLEIITGRKNSSYYDHTTFSSLVGYTWELWKQGKALEIISWLGDSYTERDVLRCIQVGLLCVQELATDRPNMSDVTFMLCNIQTTPDPPNPKKPAFMLNGSYKSDCEASTSAEGVNSINEVTVTVLEAR